MIGTIAELCDKALNYLQKVKVGNKNKTYVPTGTLKVGGKLKDFSFTITCPDYNKSVKKKCIMTVKTDGTIPDNFLLAASDEQIEREWNEYRTKYIYDKIDETKHISMSSMLLFLYLFRYFVDRKFCLFTDIYAKNNVWLYNTNSTNYSPEAMNLDIAALDHSTLDSYIKILVDEISSRDNIVALTASSSSNSCSSSSSSSSCSSSSCSSSSSSSSSLFIAYFNLH